MGVSSPVSRAERADLMFIRWKNMMGRCHSKAHRQYRNYGGRGIVVCSRWHDYWLFKADLGHCPAGHSLDRIDNNGPYSPENCRWASPKTQTSNRRNVHLVTVGGREVTLKDAASMLGVSYNTLWGRVKRGCDPQRALSLPKYKYMRPRRAA